MKVLDTLFTFICDSFRFFPLQRIIDVLSRPIRDVNFLQLKATLQGTLSCLKESGETKQNCGQTSVTLKMVDGEVEAKTIEAKGNFGIGFFHTGKFR